MRPMTSRFSRERHKLNQNSPAGKQAERHTYKWISTNSTDLKINLAGFINTQLQQKI
jgi:hypothetical protein